mgnify:CR=1 FL=1
MSIPFDTAAPSYFMTISFQNVLVDKDTIHVCGVQRNKEVCKNRQNGSLIDGKDGAVVEMGIGNCGEQGNSEKSPAQTYKFTNSVERGRASGRLGDEQWQRAIVGRTDWTSSQQGG